MKTEAEARAGAQERANLLKEPVVVFHDTWQLPFQDDYGFVSKCVWDRVNPGKNLHHVATYEPQ